jgi:antirestriction protein ArdC
VRVLKLVLAAIAFPAAAFSQSTPVREMSFHTWLKLNGHVRKGEKGIVIIAPMVFRKKETEPTEDQETRGYGFRSAYVFDISQTDGEPLPELAQVIGDPREYADRLKDCAASRGVTLEFSADLGGASGVHGRPDLFDRTDVEAW